MKIIDIIRKYSLQVFLVCLTCVFIFQICLATIIFVTLNILKYLGAK
jgi:hypothetical protein